MPPGEKKVPAEKIATIERWIAEGANTLRPEPEKLTPGVEITPEERAYWAFQPVRRPEPPAVEPGGSGELRTPIDAFILARLRHRGLAFTPEADRRTLLRRASFDLTGLPPTQAGDRRVPGRSARRRLRAGDRPAARLAALRRAVGAALARRGRLRRLRRQRQRRHGAALRLQVSRLRHPLLQRRQAARPLPHRAAGRRRAGPAALEQPHPRAGRDCWPRPASCGWRPTAPRPAACDEPLAANQVVADTLKIVSSSLLGLTVGCAQCHDHRYDPIPQTDYYRLRAVFEPALDPSHWRRPVAAAGLALHRRRPRQGRGHRRRGRSGCRTRSTPRPTSSSPRPSRRSCRNSPNRSRTKLRAARNTPAEKRTAEQKTLIETEPQPEPQRRACCTSTTRPPPTS